MATAPELPVPDESVIADAVELAERRAGEARERAAHAGLSAARSLEESARAHERLARVQDGTVDQGAPHSDVHRESAIRHRAAAAEDRELSARKREESEADLSAPPEPSRPEPLREEGHSEGGPGRPDLRGPQLGEHR